MSMVRFAMLCDRCGARSEEYTPWTTCKDCTEDICPNCDVESHRTDDEANKTLCRNCHREQSQELGDVPHASDCAVWVREDCNCGPGALFRGQ
jgi:hypothetical protein